MGWGHIGLSWTRYAKSTPAKTCGRCHLDFANDVEKCPHCGHIEDLALQDFLREQEAKQKRNTNLVIIFITALLLYVVVVLFVLPVYLK